MIIKEVVKGKVNRFIIREDNYAHPLAKFLRLYEAAKADFPDLDLTLEDIDVAHYGGKRYKRTWGIEFSLVADAPLGYTEIPHVEWSL